MPFTRATLLPMQKFSKAGIRQWKYNTADAVATVVAANYFNPAFREFSKGDIIFADCEGGTPSSEVLTVTSNTGAPTVVIRNAT